MKKEKKKPKGYWNIKENCLSEALKYSTRSDWQRGSPLSYRHACHHKWVEQCSRHMAEIRKPNGYWTLARCKAVAAKYETKVQWRLEHKASYGKAVKEGWIKQCSSHMREQSKWFGPSVILEYFLSHDIAHQSEHIFKTDEKIKRMPFDFYVPRYKFLVEFHGEQHRTGWARNAKDAESIKNRDAYKKRWAAKNGYSLLVLKQWEVSNKAEISTSLETRLRIVAKNSGKKLQLIKRKLTAKELKQIQTRLKWTLDTCLAVAMKYNSIKDWQEGSAGSYQAAFKKKWLDICTSHMTRKLHKRNHWTLQRCIEAAKKFNSKKDWAASPRSGYSTASQNGWLEICGAHFVDGRKLVGQRIWTRERCLELARSCRSRAEFKNKSGSAYHRARVRGWLEECCSHMGK